MHANITKLSEIVNLIRNKLNSAKINYESIGQSCGKNIWIFAPKENHDSINNVLTDSERKFVIFSSSLKIKK